MESQPGSETTAQSHPRASLIVSTWNGRHLLETCLPRVLQAAAQARGEHEIIVVDDASTDGSAAYVHLTFPEVRLLALKRNLRFAGANNAAARVAIGEVLVFLNNDMLVEPDFLDPLLRHFADPNLFAVTAHMKMEPRVRGGGVIRETGLVRARFENGFFVLRHEDPESAEAVPVMYAGGGSSAWRRDRFLALGGFDTLFRPFYFEDIDVSYRGQKQGWLLLFEPSSRIEHKHQQTNNATNFPPGFVELCFEKNHLLFTWKVLTDRDLIAQHFRALRRNVLAPGASPLQRRAVWRAARQLPELLAKRHRGRRGVVLSDRDVLARGESRESAVGSDGGQGGVSGGSAPATPESPSAPGTGAVPTPTAPAAPLPRTSPAARLRAKLMLLRQATTRWGLEAAEAVDRVLVIRAGSLSLVERLAAELTARYPDLEIHVAAPEGLAEETQRATGLPVIPVPAGESLAYRPSQPALDRLRALAPTTVYVAGEGNVFAEMLAVSVGGRKVEVRDDGAAHEFSLAPHKIYLLAAAPVLCVLRRAALSLVVWVIWGSIALENALPAGSIRPKRDPDR